MSKIKKYNSNSIDVNLGLEAVRYSPQIYIGNPNSDGIFQIFKEVPDNSFDESEAAHSNFVGVAIDKDTVWVVDQGRGIPIEKHHHLCAFFRLRSR